MGAVILSVSVPVVLSIVLPIVTLIAGFFIGFAIYHFVLKNKTDRSKKFANKMVEEAIAEAKNFVHSSLEHNVRTGRRIHSMFPAGFRKENGC